MAIKSTSFTKTEQNDGAVDAVIVSSDDKPDSEKVKVRVVRRTDRLIKKEAALLDDRAARHDALIAAMQEIERDESFYTKPDVLKRWLALSEESREEAESMCRLTKSIRSHSDAISRVLGLKKLKPTPRH